MAMARTSILLTVICSASIGADGIKVHSLRFDQTRMQDLSERLRLRVRIEFCLTMGCFNDDPRLLHLLVSTSVMTAMRSQTSTCPEFRRRSPVLLVEGPKMTDRVLTAQQQSLATILYLVLNTHGESRKEAFVDLVNSRPIHPDRSRIEPEI
jgi:hypothetical protein